MSVARRALSVFCVASAIYLTGGAEAAWAGSGRVLPDGNVELNVHFRFPPTQAHIDELGRWIQRASTVVCDATDGTLKIGKTRFSAGGLSEGKADVWYYFGGAGRAHSNGGPIHSENSRFYIDREDSQGGVVIAHELGHLLLDLRDQYDEQRRLGRACGIGPSFDPGTMDERNHTLMQGSRGPRQTCVAAGGGTSSGQSCFDDSDCLAGETCPLPPLSTELSVESNFRPHARQRHMSREPRWQPAGSGRPIGRRRRCFDALR